MGLTKPQERHRPGALKQQNKAHKHGKHKSKGVLDNETKGEVSNLTLMYSLSCSSHFGDDTTNFAILQGKFR